jgi:hypothetical protein
MANVNIGQIRSIVHTLPPTEVVRIQAGVLKAILDGYKGLNGNADIVTPRIPAPAAMGVEYDLTGA